MAHVLPSTVCTVIEQMYPAVIKGSDLTLTWGNEQNIAAVLAMVDAIPPELLLLPSDDYAKLVAAREVLRTGIRGFEQHGSSAPAITKLPGFTTKNPITLIYHALKKCPDSIVPESADDLAFIGHSGLRASIAEDMVQVASSISNAEWKAATVLAGSVLEAVLLDWIVDQDPHEVEVAMAKCGIKKDLKANPPEKWHLRDYIKVAAETGFIDDDIVGLVNATKNYRNLIHPGREVRTRQRCSRETAFAAASAMDAIIRLRQAADN